MKEFKLQDDYQNLLHVYEFSDVFEVKGIVQIVHGINEHGLRYRDFARYLNQAGYIVYVHDHVSQGYSRTQADKDRKVVYFGKHGLDVLVNGLQVVFKYIQSQFPNTKIYAFGHSLGAIIIRNYWIDFDNKYDKVILNGTGYRQEKGLSMAIFIGRIFKIFKAKKPSSFFDKSFRQTQLKLNEVTQIDHFIEWLTRDEDYTNKNKKDPFLYIRLSVSTFVDMLYGMKRMNNKNNILNYRIKEPILLLSGTHDAATNFGLDTQNLHEMLVEHGYNSHIKLYFEGRHDSIQEINKEEVFEDIIQFIGGRS